MTQRELIFTARAAFDRGDYATALRLLRPLANQGNAYAQSFLGFMYHNGQGVAQNYAEAMKWYRLAADQGDAPAQSALGAVYADAHRDYVSAYMWFSLSAAQGYQNGAINRDALGKRMTPAQIAEAQKRAIEWKGNASEVDGDLAVVLASEFDIWFRNMSAKGALRAFTGLTKDGKQAVVILTDLPFDDVQRRNFLIWLCRMEQFVAYAYGTRVGTVDESGKINENIDIYASSNRYDVWKSLGIEKLTDGTYRLFDQNQIVAPARSKDVIFFGLQGSTDDTPSGDQELFRKLWSDLKPKAMWRQR